MLARGSRGSGQAPPTVDELRRLQRRLSEATGKLPEKRGPLRSVASGSSISTMAPDVEELATRSVASINHVLSSGSVSTMVSWGEEAMEDEGVAIGPIVEEETNASNTDPRGSSDAEPEEDGEAAGASIASHCALRRAKDFSHNRVPRNLNLAEEYSRGSQEGPPTTMMIRNIPNRYTQRELIRELEELGFGGTFDFLYVPIDKATMCNVGYAFVNFVDHRWAAKCMQVFDNYPFKKYRKARGKIATVSVAHIQGLEANMRHYENAAVNGVSRARRSGPVVMASLASSVAGP